MKKGIILFTVIMLVTTITVLGLLFFKPIDPKDVVKAFEKNKTNLVIEDLVIDTEKHPIVDEDILIPISTLKEYIYEDVELSKKYDRLYLGMKAPKFKLETDNLTEKIKEGVNLNFLVKEINDTHYIDIEGFEKIFNIKVNYIEDTNILTIDKTNTNMKKGKITERTYLRPKDSFFSFRMDKLHKGDEIKVFNDDGKWLKVRTEKGYIGYVVNKKVKIIKDEKKTDNKLNSVRSEWNKEGKINLVWDYIRKDSPKLAEDEKIKGLDVISPTWFSIVDESGYIVNNGDINYVKDAHDKGYKVWALVDNSFDRDLTNELLKSEESQNRVIEQLIVYSSLYNLDGINIDFENVYYKDKDRLTSFIAKLTKALKEQKLVVSMDMTVPSSSLYWSKFYDREKLGDILDYCMVMTYDEHWATSPKSGSVASIDWVKRGIEKTLKYIPKEKVLMGIPFYTREWEEKKVNGKIKVSSKALSMESVKEKIEERDLKVKWLKEEGQNYTEYNKDDNVYRIWIEDERSIKLKASLVNEYDIAGVCSWRKGFEKEVIWTVLNNVIKKDKELVMKGE
ncbi:MAG: glycoside hydrolase [Firmicutes bacterium]|nr:glycoside hydrolase [Bacillota bacterium]